MSIINLLMYLDVSQQYPCAQCQSNKKLVTSNKKVVTAKYTGCLYLYTWVVSAVYTLK